VIAFRQFDSDYYAEAESVPAGIRAGLTRHCAECGADLTRPNDAPIAPAALFVYPPASDGLTLLMSPASRVAGYAMAACLDCTPGIAARIAASMADQEAEHRSGHHVEFEPGCELCDEVRRSGAGD